MHAAAYSFVADMVTKFGPFVTVLEVGSRDVNGSVRGLFNGAAYTGVDVVDGPGVDVVADAAESLPGGPYDAVVCCETFEHASGWVAIVDNASRVLASGGWLLMTMAGPGREPHSAIDGGHVRAGEHYANIDPDELGSAVRHAGLATIELVHATAQGDVYCAAVKAV